MIRQYALKFCSLAFISACALSPQSDKYLPPAEGQPATPDRLKNIQAISLEVKLELPAKTPDAWAAEAVRRLLTYSGYKVVAGKAPARAVLRLVGVPLGDVYSSMGNPRFFYAGTRIQATLDLYPDQIYVSSIPFYRESKPGYIAMVNLDMLAPQGAPFEADFLSPSRGFARHYFDEVQYLFGDAPVLKAVADDGASEHLRKTAYELIGVRKLMDGFPHLKRALAMNRSSAEHYAVVDAMVELAHAETEDVLLDYVRRKRSDPRYDLSAGQAVGVLARRPPAGTMCELSSMFVRYKMYYKVDEEFANIAVAEGGPVCFKAFGELLEIAKKESESRKRYSGYNPALWQERISLIENTIQRLQTSK